MTRKPPNNNAEKPLAGKLAGQLLLLASLAVFMGGGLVMAARVVPPLLHVDMDQKVSGVGTVMAILFACCVLAIFLVYVSVAVWMLVARLFHDLRDGAGLAAIAAAGGIGSALVITP